MQLKIEYLSKNELKPYVNNAKIHTQRQVEQIKKSIEEFDFNDPIAVWGENEIVEGHGRLLAAMEMDDIDTVPVIRLDHLTDKQRKAYALAHNKLTMNTDFDLDILAREVADIEGTLDLTDFGFNEAELLELEIDTEPEKLPPVPQAVPRFEGIPAQDAQEGSQEDHFGGYPAYGEGLPVGAEEVAKEDLKDYKESAERLVSKRVIIVYRTDEEEAFVKELLGEPQDRNLGVIYLAENIMKDKNKQE